MPTIDVLGTNLELQQRFRDHFDKSFNSERVGRLMGRLAKSAYSLHSSPFYPTEATKALELKACRAATVLGFVAGVYDRHFEFEVGDDYEYGCVEDTDWELMGLSPELKTGLSARFRFVLDLLADSEVEESLLVEVPAMAPEEVWLPQFSYGYIVGQFTEEFLDVLSMSESPSAG